MADTLLSIEDSTLQGIADAIRNKSGGTAPLIFPDGFVSALQTIETEATVTPKIVSQQVTLTPSNPSFAIAAGFHDGTGTVKIETETGSATPTSTEQTYYPSAGKFFSSFYVGGAGGGYKVVTGSFTASSAASFSISNLGMTPVGALVVLAPTVGNPTPETCVFCFNDSQGGSRFLSARWRPKTKITLDNYTTISLSTNEVTVDPDERYVYLNGTYQYMIWGN